MLGLVHDFVLSRFLYCAGRSERQQKSIVLQASAILEDAPTQLDVSKVRDWHSCFGRGMACYLYGKSAQLCPVSDDCHMLQMEPLGDRILIKPDEEKNVSINAIYHQQIRPFL